MLKNDTTSERQAHICNKSLIWGIYPVLILTSCRVESLEETVDITKGTFAGDLSTMMLSDSQN